jgi:hypothetical protein
MSAATHGITRSGRTMSASREISRESTGAESESSEANLLQNLKQLEELAARDVRAWQAYEALRRSQFRNRWWLRVFGG